MISSFESQVGTWKTYSFISPKKKKKGYSLYEISPVRVKGNQVTAPRRAGCWGPLGPPDAAPTFPGPAGAPGGLPRPASLRSCCSPLPHILTMDCPHTGLYFLKQRPLSRRGDCILTPTPLKSSPAPEAPLALERPEGPVPKVSHQSPQPTRSSRTQGVRQQRAAPPWEEM